MGVIADQVAKYDSLLCEAGPTVFNANGWRLMLSAQSNSELDGIAPPPGLVTKLLHLWEIPCFDSLPSVMAAAADNTSYVVAQQLTIDEMQNLFVALRWDNPIGLPATNSGLFIAETLQVDNDMQKRNAFATYMDNAVYQMNEKYGWQIRFAGNASTGIIDQYVQIWEVPTFQNLEPQLHYYRSNPSWAAVVQLVRTELWKNHSLNCNSVLSGTTCQLQEVYDKQAAVAPAGSTTPAPAPAPAK